MIDCSPDAIMKLIRKGSLEKESVLLDPMINEALGNELKQFPVLPRMRVEKVQILFRESPSVGLHRRPGADCDGGELRMYRSLNRHFCLMFVFAIPAFY